MPSRRAAFNVALFDEVLDPEYITPDDTLQPKPTESSLPLPPELRGLVFQHCDVSTIQQLRLVNRQTEADASHYLFSTLTVALQKRQLRRLQRIARIPKFAKGVKVLVWETAQYSAKEEGVDLCTAESVGKLLYELKVADIVDTSSIITNHDIEGWYGLANYEREVWKERGIIGLARYKSLQNFEETLLAELLQTPSVISDHIAALSSLRAVTLTLWAEKRNRRFFDVGSLTGSSTRMPPPFLAAEDTKAARTLQNKAVQITDFGILEGELKIERYHIVPTCSDTLSPLAEDYELPSMMVDFETLAYPRRVLDCDDGDKLEKRYDAVKDLHLDLSHVGYINSNTGILIDLRDSAEHIMEYFGSLAKVETLNLGLCAQKDSIHQTTWTTAITLESVLKGHHFPHLRNLTISDMWLEPAEVCDFMLAHADTLKTIRLSNIQSRRPGYSRAACRVGHNPGTPASERGRAGEERAPGMEASYGECNPWMRAISRPPINYELRPSVSACCLGGFGQRYLAAKETYHKMLPSCVNLGIGGPSVGQEWKVLSDIDFESIQAGDENEIDAKAEGAT
ncbi:hypothetical protein LTR10_009561 [Elasticomyces elasticus]|nr:hypothetical protein LTR10_009561 [Elasticomyces elasticus]KAK4971345.1 hypothetical protein LTR42_007071 [Elasticomyces elasticus]